MAGTILGIEIGAATIKFAEVRGKTLVRCASYPLPDNLVHDGLITSPDGLIEVLKQAKKELKLKSGPCALVIPSRAVITHQVTMPLMSEADVALNLPFEFRDFVGKDSDKYLYDYSVQSIQQPAGKQGGSMELYAAAVEAKLMEEYYSWLKKAGFTMKVAIPAEMSWENLIRACKNLPKEVCIVDMGATHTMVTVYKDGHYVMGKDIDIGGGTMDEVIAGEYKLDARQARNYKELDPDQYLPCCTEAMNDLAVEVMRVVNFYSYHTEGAALQDIYLCGGSVTESLRTAVLKATDMQLHHICRLVPGGVENSATARSAIAAGAAMQ